MSIIENIHEFHLKLAVLTSNADITIGLSKPLFDKLIFEMISMRGYASKAESDRAIMEANQAVANQSVKLSTQFGIVNISLI